MRIKRLWLRIFLKLVLIFSFVLGTFFFEHSSAQANAIDNSMPTLAYTNQEGEQISVPDFTNLTFGKLPPIEEAGWISIAKEFVKQLGYDPSREWGELANVADVIKLGDIEDAFGVGKFSLSTIANITHLDLKNTALSAFEIAGRQSIGDLVKAIPDLGELDVSQVKPIADLLRQVGGGDWNEKIGAIAQNEALANLQLGKYLDLSKYGLDSIPGLLTNPLQSFHAWQQSSVSGILGNLGLASVPFASFPIPLLNGGIKVGKVDLVWGNAEHGDPQAPADLFISGAVKDKSDRTTPVPCVADKPCPYIELTDAINPIKANDKVTDSFKSLHGKRWVVGGSKGMKVKEGYGPLKMLNGGWGAAGITVFGADFGKIALTSTDESTGRAKFSLYLRACARIPFVGKSCSPYFIGPIPFPLLNTKEKGFVLVASTAKPKVDIPSKYQDQITQIQQPYEPQITNADDTTSSGTLCGTGLGGVDLEALADGISGIEGNYSSRGQWGCDKQGNCGRGLGRYQLMTYRSDVKESIEKQPGGQSFYSRISSGYNPSAAELNQYFPPASQDALFVAAQKANINKLTNKGVSGDGLVACLGQMWYSGRCTNSNGRDYTGGPTISQYGQILVSNYRKALAKLGSKTGKTCAIASSGEAGNGKVTGKFINPAPNAPVTSDFGPRSKPCTGCSDFHKGIDIGVGNGTNVKAADGGTVIYAGTAKGYGNVLIVDHGNGLQTRYAHLESFTVPKGAKVSQGQIVAKSDSTGVGTGAHLHFEVRENASANKAPFDPSIRAVNPEKYVKF